MVPGWASLRSIVPPQTADEGLVSEKIAPVSDLITIEEARRVVLAAVPPLGDEPVELDLGQGLKEGCQLCQSSYAIFFVFDCPRGRQCLAEHPHPL